MPNRSIVNLIVSCIRRFPFWEALSLMMLFGEMELNMGHKIQIPLQLVYLDVGLLILLGTFMSFNSHWKRSCASMAAVQMAVHCVVELYFHKIKLTMRIHIILRNIGVVASYLLIAAGVGEYSKAKRAKITQLSSFVFGLLLAAQAYLFVTSEFEQDLVKNILPRQIRTKAISPILFPILTFMLALCAYSFMMQKAGYKQAKRFALVFWFCVALTTDLTVFRWTRKLETWTCIRLLVSSLTTLGGIVVLNLFDT